MKKFSATEIDYIRQSICRGVREDLRSFDTSRKTIQKLGELPRADGYVKLERGRTLVELSVQFKETEATLKELNVNPDLFPEAIEVLESNIAIPRVLESILHEFLEDSKIGMKLEMNVIHDDGNVYDLLFHGLSIIFTDIDVPDIYDLKNTRKAKINIPFSITYAIYGDSFILDPTLLEEKSADGLLHLYRNSDQKILGCHADKVSVTKESIAKFFSIQGK